ncbi:MAG: DMT family transporter [Hyphomicrobiales bacterium]
MLVFATLISSSFTVGAAITDALEPVALTFLRFVLATVIFFAIAAFTRHKIKRPVLDDVPRYGLLGLLLALYFTLMFEALRWTSSLSTGAIFTLAPPATVAISWILLGQRFSSAQWLALAVSGLGAIWVMFDGSLQRLLEFSIGKGEVIFLIGALAYAAYSPFVRKLNMGEHLVDVTIWTLVAAAIILGIFGFSTITTVNWSAVPTSVYIGIAHLALFTTACSSFLIQYASLRLPSGKVMAYMYIIPALIVAQNVMFEGKLPSFSVLIGVIIISTATFALQRL